MCVLAAASSATAVWTVHGTAMTGHPPIMISGDLGFTSVNGVVAGTGVRADPYMIDGWIINSTVSQIGINVSNTRSYFIIQNVRVVDYRFQDHGVGIQFYNVTHGTVETSAIDSNRVGVSLYSSSNVTFSSNEVANNTVDGIYVGYGSANLTFAGNRFTSDGLNFESTLTKAQEWASFTITPDNTVNGLSIAFYHACSGITVDGAQIGQLIVANCNNVEITHLSISNSESAVQVAYVSNLLIANSTLTMNHQSIISLSFVNNTTVQGITANLGGGIDVWHANNLTLSDNFISNAGGVSLSYASNVTIRSNVFARNLSWALFFYLDQNVHVFHNDFIWNYQADFVDHVKDVYYWTPASVKDSWDNGYPSGGNYWTAYNGVDNCSGEGQNNCRCDPPSFLTCRDGIGDTPYVITGYFSSLAPADRYPLIRPYHRDTTPPSWSPHDGFQPGINSLYLRYTSVWLYWTTATDDVKVTSYQIYSSNVLLATLPASQDNVQGYNVTTLTAGNTYTFQIVAIDEDGNASPPLSFTLTTPTTVAAAPSIPAWYLAPILVAAAFTVVIAIFVARRYDRSKGSSRLGPDLEQYRHDVCGSHVWNWIQNGLVQIISVRVSEG